MKKNSYSYTFTSPRTAEEVFDLLKDPGKWWTGLYEETIKGKYKDLNDEFSFRAGNGAHYTKQKLAELLPGRRIAWLITESDLNFVNKTGEWTGTKLVFDLVPGNKGTRITFTHEGLVPQFECYGACSAGWTGYLDKLKKKLQ